MESSIANDKIKMVAACEEDACTYIRQVTLIYLLDLIATSIIFKLLCNSIVLRNFQILSSMHVILMRLLTKPPHAIPLFELASLFCQSVTVRS